MEGEMAKVTFTTGITDKYLARDIFLNFTTAAVSSVFGGKKVDVNKSGSVVTLTTWDHYSQNSKTQE